MYRSGLKFRPPLAGGGHCWQIIVRSQDGAPRGSLWAATHRPVPTVWRCVACYETAPSWALTEGFYSRPCRGRVRALPQSISTVSPASHASVSSTSTRSSSATA